LFAFVVTGLVTEPLPGPALGLIGVSAAAGLSLVGRTPAESMRWALSGFSNEVVWLVFSATTFALGYQATGLGRRIALLLVKTLGRRTLGLGYAIALCDLALAPFMPSNTARSAGTIFPVVRNIPPLYGSSANDDARAVGGYLCWTAFATTCVTSSMFLTALAPNLLAAQMARTLAGLTIDWRGWMLGFLPVGIPLFLLTPLVTYLAHPPKVERGAEVVSWAKGELERMGALTRREALMASLAVGALVCWIFGSEHVAAVTVALVVVSLMVLTGVVSWGEVMGNAPGWNVLVWFATLVALADGLREVGFLAWFAERSSASLAGLPVAAGAVAIVSLFFAIHYLFASLTAHTTAVLPVFLTALSGIAGMPAKPVALTLVYSIGLMGVLTPYATGPAPVWLSAGYLRVRDFWKLGLLMGVLYLGTLLAVGLPTAFSVAR
jgi:L-tartrate/succinate antiporter